MPELKVLFTREQIAERVAAIGAAISRDFAGEPVLLVGVLKGATIFLSDLARSITLDATFDFIAVSSYKDGTRSSGEVRMVKDLDETIEGRNVVLVEDILDTGITLTYLRTLLLARKPKRLAVTTLLDKPSRRVKPFVAEYVGFEIANEFVVGYGMDCDEQFRNLPDTRIHPEAQ